MLRRQRTGGTRGQLVGAELRVQVFVNGISNALDNLAHGALLQGEAYDTSVKIMANRLRIGVVKAYSDTPTLNVLQGDSDGELTFESSGDDTNLPEAREFLKSVHGESDDIRSPTST
ncbi:hypothetical protein PF006_g13712 [Phytophthora fragariae]|uniref:Uncharacterized protein n=2 Tax=Phytophthora fragariae TaxID=53985 RepID=A0A6A3TMK1_9STRA|nr:hypothetical protein PF003_g6738 [Phytophthora fragariae]KAE9139540.1 hypothetical protein PF006_g13712 [Phytophthora fragariae]